MENEITVASFKEAAKGPDGPEKIAQLIMDLVSDRNHWKEGAQELALHQLTVERERDELQALLRAYDLNKASLEGFINDLKAENRKLREAWTKAPWAGDTTGGPVD